MRGYGSIGFAVAFLVCGILAGGQAAPEQPMLQADGVSRILVGTIQDQKDDRYAPDGEPRPVFVAQGGAWYPLLENEVLERIEAVAGPYRFLGVRKEGEKLPPIERKTVKVEGRFSRYRGRNYFRITALIKVLEEPAK